MAARVFLPINVKLKILDNCFGYFIILSTKTLIQLRKGFFELHTLNNSFNSFRLSHSLPNRMYTAFKFGIQNKISIFKDELRALKMVLIEKGVINSQKYMFTHAP